MLRVALAQINPTVGDLPGNKKIISASILQAKKRQVDIVAFPEMSICGYPPEDLLHKPHFIKDNIRVLRSLCKDAKGIIAIIGYVDIGEKQELYNAAAVIADGNIVGTYRKEELPNYGVFDEKRYFVHGKNNKKYLVGKTCLGVTICEDIWVENGGYKNLSKQGASVLFNLSCSPFDVGKLKLRKDLLRKRAVSTKSFVCYVNLVGGQDELVFDGSSMIIDPKGKIVTLGEQFKEGLIVSDIDVGNNLKKKVALKDTVKIKSLDIKKKENIQETMLPRKLGMEERVYEALVIGTKDYIKKNGFQKVVIGLSGGIDSSLVAAVAVEAIGKKNVIGVTMPSQFTSKGTKSDAVKLADNLGIKIIEMPIEKVCLSYEKTLSGEFKGLKSDVAEENIQARVRGNLLMALSNKFGWLVLTTGNKSEFSVGYCTLYGDMSGGFAVLKDVPKILVYELSEFINEKYGEMIPVSVIKRAPSAELRENQTDQDSLPPYDVLDAVLEDYIEKHRSIAHMSRKYGLTLAKKIVSMVDRTEYKRRQAAPGIKITQRAFGKDWRLPVTNKYTEI